MRRPSELHTSPGSALRGRGHGVGVAALMCGILALFLLSVVYGPVSNGSVVIGALDIVALAFVTMLTDRTPTR